MIDGLKFEIQVSLFALQKLFGTEIVISGSVADYFNICGKVRFFKPKDIDVTMTKEQLLKLKKHFFVRKVEGLYHQGTTEEYFTTICGCGIDIFVKDEPMLEDTEIFEFEHFKLRHQSRKERLKQHNISINNKLISDHRKRKHLNRLTFYKIQDAHNIHS